MFVRTAKEPRRVEGKKFPPQKKEEGEREKGEQRREKRGEERKEDKRGEDEKGGEGRGGKNVVLGSLSLICQVSEAAPGQIKKNLSYC